MLRLDIHINGFYIKKMLGFSGSSFWLLLLVMGGRRDILKLMLELVLGLFHLLGMFISVSCCN